ncbi:MAG: hypothetical protein ACJ0GK_03505 [Gammaproteobacteria bacterium]|tara:strand:- start:28068 stop:28802 length:735 start_codon:yes stop_codon:yes gene_type:complete
MSNISDYDFSRISAFVDGELSTEEVDCLIKDMKIKPELKEVYFNIMELSEAAKELKPIGFKQQLANMSLQSLFSAFNQRLVMPMTIFSVGALLSYSILNNAINNNDTNKASLLLQQSISSIEAKQILENIKSDEILQFASRHYAPNINKNIMPVAYQPQWLPRGFNTDDRLNNRFINRANKKEFSIFIDSPNTLNLPDGVYKKENFILIKKTFVHSDKPHTIAIFGDIDIESGKRILNSIRPIK